MNEASYFLQATSCIKWATSMQHSNDPRCPRCQKPIGADAPHGLCPKCVLDAVAKTGTEVRDVKASHPSLDEVAKCFPELEIVEVIGIGGMGVVYKARQTKLGRFVALKLLSAELAEHSVFVERFNREGRVLAQLNHPHIVNIFDFGARGDFLYLLMEFVDGVNLREAMQAGTIAPADCLALVQDICSALQFAHDQGVLHRDIKPENVLLDQHGRVKLADFGIAKLVSSEARENISLTNQGAVLGTLHYMAPEQLETPRAVDHRADIYSLGVVFYELLTGELPIGRFPSPSDASKTDPRLDKVVLRALEKRRDLRYQTVEEVNTDIESLKPQNSSVHQGNTPEPTAYGSPEPVRSKTWNHSRYATLSAILTGASLLPLLLLVFVVIPFFLLVGVGSSSAETQHLYRPSIFVYLLAAPVILVMAATGILGTLFGLIALCKINPAEGPTRLVRALFGGLTWPVLLVVGYLLVPFDSLSFQPTNFGPLRSRQVPENLFNRNPAPTIITPSADFNSLSPANSSMPLAVIATANRRLERELKEWTYSASVFNEAPGARNGFSSLAITTARNGRYWHGPKLGFCESMFASPDGIQLTQIEVTRSYRGVCRMNHPELAVGMAGMGMLGGRLDPEGMRMVGLFQPATMWFNPSVGQEDDQWEDDSCFPIYNQSQLEKFIDRIPRELPVLYAATKLVEPVRTEWPNEEPLKNQDPLLKIPDIDFNTHFAMVMLNYGTLTSVPIVECVQYQERPAVEKGKMGDWTNRIWIDVEIPQLYYNETCPSFMGTYKLIVIPNPGTYGSLNFRFSQTSELRSHLIPPEPGPLSDDHRTYQYRDTGLYNFYMDSVRDEREWSKELEAELDGLDPGEKDVGGEDPTRSRMSVVKEQIQTTNQKLEDAVMEVKEEGRRLGLLEAEIKAPKSIPISQGERGD